MKKSNLFLAAVASVVIAAPTIASAQGVTINAGERGGIHRDRGEFRGAHAEMRGHHHHKVIVIHKGHRHHHG